MEKYHYPAAIFSFMQFEGGRYLRPFWGKQWATYSLLRKEPRLSSTPRLHKLGVYTFFDMLLIIIEQMIIIYTVIYA